MSADTYEIYAVRYAHRHRLIRIAVMLNVDPRP
jgi:hypothetical protein